MKLILQPQLRLVTPGCRPSPWKNNLLMADYAFILGMLLRGDRGYRLATAYIEFQNVASPGDPADAVVYDRTESAEYYASLASSPDRDYLRVPFVLGEPQLDDEENFPRGNLLLGFAVSDGATGVHGKTFSEGANSVVAGAAVVATPDRDDPTQDLIFSRWYLDEPDQWPKTGTQQTTIEWRLPLPASLS